MKSILSIIFIIIMTFPLKAQQASDNSLGDLKKSIRTENGILLETSFGIAQVIIYTPEIIRIRIDKTSIKNDFSYAVIAKPEKTNFKIFETEGLITLKTDSLRLDIYTNPVRFNLSNNNNQLLCADDTFGTNWVGEEVTTYKKLHEDEKFIGLGEKTGNLNRRGEGYTNWNSDVPGYTTSADPLYSTFPFYIGIHHDVAYGIFFDNTYKSYFNFGASNDRFSSFGADAGEMNYYMIGGASISRIIQNYTFLTGVMPLPPIWALGNQQSRWSYFPDKEVLKIGSTFREKTIPLDVLYLDIHYMDAYKVFTFHPDRFSKPKALTSQLKALGIHTAVIIDPGIKVEKGYTTYEEGVKNRLYIKYPDGTNYTAQVWPGWCHFPDFTMPAARKWWGESFKVLTDAGVTGFWNDMNEIASWGAGRTPSMVKFNWEGMGAAYREGKNMYGMQMARSTYEGARELMQTRPLILTRAAYSGAQRYTAIWTGDNVASEEHMMLGCRLVNSLGITGMPFAGVDVGGFMGDASKGLFSRWISIGAFTPFFRVHKHYDYNSSEPWSYGADVENISRNYISLRYKLMPYIYSAFYEAHKTGLPVSRSLVIENTFDEKCWYWAYQHQYLFGSALLIAPVESTIEICKTYLPKGNWFDFFTGKAYSGNQEIMVESPIDKLPVFVKGGSIVPMQKTIQSTSENPGDTLYVHIYFGTTSVQHTYYEDDGISYNYESGKCLEVNMMFNAEEQKVILPSISSNLTGNYVGKFSTIIPILHGFEPYKNNIKVNGKAEATVVSSIDILNVHKPGSAEWLNSREIQQPVIILPGLSTTRQNEISW